MTKDIDALLPPAQYKRHTERTDAFIDLLSRYVRAYWHDYPSTGGIRNEMASLLGDARINFNNGPSTAYMHISLRDHDNVTVTMPRSDAGCERYVKRLEGARERIRSGRVAVTDWASSGIDPSCLQVLCRILQHLDREDAKGDLFLADRFAILALAANGERNVEGRDLTDLVRMATDGLAGLRDRWSRRELNRYGVQRTRNLLHADHDGETERESILPTKAVLPASVMMRRNDRLEDIVSLPGVDALGLRIRKMTRDHDGHAEIHTDAWDRRNLVMLRISPRSRRTR